MCLNYSVLKKNRYLALCKTESVTGLARGRLARCTDCAGIVEQSSWDGLGISRLICRHTYSLEIDFRRQHLVASELKDPICHSDECQIGSFSSEVTICRQILPSKVDTRTVRVKIIIMTVDPLHRYSNEPKIAD